MATLLPVARVQRARAFAPRPHAGEVTGAVTKAAQAPSLQSHPHYECWRSRPSGAWPSRGDPIARGSCVPTHHTCKNVPTLPSPYVGCCLARPCRVLNPHTCVLPCPLPIEGSTPSGHPRNPFPAGSHVVLRAHLGSAPPGHVLPQARVTGFTRTCLPGQQRACPVLGHPVLGPAEHLLGGPGKEDLDPLAQQGWVDPGPRPAGLSLFLHF